MTSRSTATWTGYDVLRARLEAARRPPPALLDELEQILYDDNYEGLLAGTDKHGVAMAPTVRQGLSTGHWVHYRLPDGRPAGYFQPGRAAAEDQPAGVHSGDGGPLAPRGPDSRVIENYRTAHFEDGPNQWVIFGAWENVVSESGVPFLPFHFTGQGRLPVRDLAGLRPEGLRRAVEAVERWGFSLGSKGP